MAIFSWLKKNNETAQPILNNNQSDSDKSFFETLKTGLKRTRVNLASGLGRIFLGKKTIDNHLLEELETLLIGADIGLDVTKKVIDELTAKIARQELDNLEVLYGALAAILQSIISPYSLPLEISDTTKPYVILLVGINGSGKTTTIGKLAKKLQEGDKKVVLAAGDTFRAAAIEQLKIWGERNAIDVIAQQQGSDSAAVIYDAFFAAKARNADVLLVDTAGRLHTQNNLMDELKKIKRILGKIDTTAPHEVLLVLDATIGQNALNQAKQFYEAIGVTGLCITKLDGTARGGIIFAIAQQLKLPIRFIGIGEGIDDLKPFIAKDFVDALLAPTVD
jgi:fused signal recognition particle receptor